MSRSAIRSPTWAPRDRVGSPRDHALVEDVNRAAAPNKAMERTEGLLQFMAVVVLNERVAGAQIPALFGVRQPPELNR
jgi:hypothetical protein